MRSITRCLYFRYFLSHIDSLKKKKRSGFKQLLEETTAITLTTRWKEAKKLIKRDPRYSKFSSSDRVIWHSTFSMVKGVFCPRGQSIKSGSPLLYLITFTSFTFGCPNLEWRAKNGILACAFYSKGIFFVSFIFGARRHLCYYLPYHHPTPLLPATVRSDYVKA